MTPAIRNSPSGKVVEYRIGQLRDQRLLVVVGRGADQLLVRPLGDLHAGFLRQQDDAHEQRHRRCTPSSSSVVAALRDLGFRNAGTPLLIASTPVSAAQPDENARATRNTMRKPDDVAVFGVQLEARRLGAQRRAEHVDLKQPPGRA